MTETPLDMFDSAWIGPVLLLLNQYFVITEKETLLLWICIVSTVKLIEMSCGWEEGPVRGRDKGPLNISLNIGF